MLSNEVLQSLNCLSSESITDILDALARLSIKSLKQAQAFPGRSGQTIEVTDDANQKYYIGLSEYGFVEIIRKDSPTGTILFVPIDD